MKIKSVRGTHDLLPESMGLWQQIESTARRVFQLYGYEEVRTPIFEKTELFARSIGAESDIVQKEMYTFNDSKGNPISLRPEGTAPVVRAYLEHGLHHDKSVSKLYYIGPMFRHERPQKGRYRQFHQVGVEVLGSDHPALEAEVIEMLDRFLRDLGASKLQLLVNSVGCPKCRPGYVKILKEELDKIQDGLCPECQRRSTTNPLRVLDCKVPACQPLIDGLPSILDHLCEECRQHFEKFRGYLELQNIPFEVVPRLVRGLDYYVGTTFEMISSKLGPTQNAVVGGGRYDGLPELLGGPPTRGFGFALGIERLVVLLEENEPRLRPGPDIFLAYLDQSALQEALGLARELRDQGVSAYVDFEGRSLKAQMRLANKLQSLFTCVIGDDEVKSGQFPIKRMEDGHQITQTREAIASYVKEDGMVTS
jgi:histidyl-tRNA synthetase